MLFEGYSANPFWNIVFSCTTQVPAFPDLEDQIPGLVPAVHRCRDAAGCPTHLRSGRDAPASPLPPLLDLPCY